MSLIGSVQAKPTIGGDNALKAVLRFMFNDRHVHLRMPSNSEELTQEANGLVNRLNVWSDASHAPYRFNGRRGVSGEVVAYHNSVLRTVAKQQQSVSLSSWNYLPSRWQPRTALLCLDSYIASYMAEEN